MSTDRRAIERLLWRAGFGPRPGDVGRMARVGLEGAVAELVAPKGRAYATKPSAGRKFDPVNRYGHDVLWWLDRAVRTNHPLVERMTLNWHDHFATSNSSVNDPAAMLRQYHLLRRGSLGRFDRLAIGLTHDLAMQDFLSLLWSSKDSPNENFARELFELFTLGVDGGYTETDIREAARALTGFWYDEDSGRQWFEVGEHDRGTKTILGHTGRFGPDDVVRIAVAHPNHAPFLCRKLWGYFTPRDVPQATLDELVGIYRGGRTLIGPVVRRILVDPVLYEDLDEPDQIKPPFVHAAGMLRATRTGVTREDWEWMVTMMGQRPFQPPNVGGWPGGLAWVSTATFRSRFVAASLLLEDLSDRIRIADNTDADGHVRAALAATGWPTLTPRTDAVLRRVASDSRLDAKAKQSLSRHILLAGPDAHVC
jgi:uncharacterized protein (DUF1800 family)